MGTIMSMSLTWFLPRSMPLIVGTEKYAKPPPPRGHRRVVLLEPPVDTRSDDPSVVDGKWFRAKYGIGGDESFGSGGLAVGGAP